jgi:serine/threonine protein kinase
MSPEQAAGDAGCPASDVFSFGLMLYEMLTGRPAIGDDSPLVFMYKLRTEDLAGELAAHVPPGYRPLLVSLLSRDPLQRPLMQEVVEQLASLGGNALPRTSMAQPRSGESR